MKNLSIYIFLFLSFSISAQERFIDDSFNLQKTETKTFATKNGEALKLDIYQPEKDSLQFKIYLNFKVKAR